MRNTESKREEEGFDEELTPIEVEEENEMTPRKKDVKINTKYVVVIVLIGLLIAAGYHFRSIFVAATVNGSPISRIAVVRELEKTSGKQVLQSLITQKVIADEVKKKGIAVGNEEVDAEVKRISDMVAAQGGTIEMALAAQGMTMDDFRNRALTQIQVEKLLGDKVAVTDAEVDSYIKENKINLPKEKPEEVRAQIKDQLKRQKVSEEGQKLVDSLLQDAKVTYYVNY